MRILITGATGTVGRNVVEQVLAFDPAAEVRALTRNPEADLPAGVEIAVGDLAAPETLAEAFKDVDAVHFINFAGEQYGALPNPDAVVALAEQAGVRRATVLGGMATGPLEQRLSESAIETTFLRPVEFMSNAVMWWAAPIKAESRIREPFGDRLSAMVHPADIGAVAARVLLDGGYDGETLVITGPEVLTMQDKVRLIGDAIGREVEYVELTVDEARDKWRGEGFHEGMIAFLLEALGNTPVEGKTVADTVERVTGRPALTFAQWAQENADAFK
ncbi:NmrA family NAD(P)-binding protein [Glycomyces terrestris]|uniref:NAD-dependent epimerase/dehydratase family protein n=1 Tax=Glycomyces terrestris TaxID=2493553 RepID=A0A426URJ3_9ACTN|nr:NmrA family NAD(P)-binding protein [Glycomyces terrestris]RRR95789.1 NAD-dependent epimerase/dehydratase family protein [Glycomyces terrestris]